MARGRRKSLTKKIVREHKYNPPSVDYNSLEEELHEQLINPNADSGPVVPVWYEEPEDTSITAVMDEDEIDEYAKWAMEAAEKAEQDECTEDKAKANAESLAKLAAAAKAPAIKAAKAASKSEDKK